MSLFTVLDVVEAVGDARARIPPALRDWTFFSAHDHWRYHLDLKPTTCNVCIAFAQAAFYPGNDLRGLFPDLEIVDMYRIQVKVHPNCGCWLERFHEGEA